MGSNQSKPCSGDPERESRRAEQERIQQMHLTQQASPPSSDTEQPTVHIHCNLDEVDQFLEETNTSRLMFHFRVVKVQSENSLEGSETQSASETSEAAEMASPTLVEAKIAEPGGDAAEQLEPNRDVVVRSEPNGDITVGTDAQPTELDLPLACLCDKVVRALHVVEKTFRDASGHSAVKEAPPSCTEPHLSLVSSSSQTPSPPVATVEPPNAGDIHCPTEEAFPVSDWKAPCETDLELAAEVAPGAAEEPTARKTPLNEAASEETLEEGAVDVLPGLPAGTSDERSGVSAHLSSQELAEIPLSLRKDLPGEGSEPRLIMDGTDEKGQGGCCKEESRGEMLQRRARREMLAGSETDEETEPPLASRLFYNSKWAQVFSCAAGEKVDDDGSLLAGDAANVDSLEDGSIPAAEGVKLPECKVPVAQHVEAQPATEVEETTEAPASPKALLETAAVGQDGPTKEAHEACPDEPVVQGTGTPAHALAAQVLPGAAHVPGRVLQDGASGQKDTESAVTKQN